MPAVCMELSAGIRVNQLLQVAWWLKAMTKVGFDSYVFGLTASDDESGDVCGPGAAYRVPLMVRRKLIGETSG
ncbi:MAG: hypothetical protein WBC64_03160, partial [Methylovirgula sp.]